jgi:glycerol-3-phosphate dehydrogenase
MYFCYFWCNIRICNFLIQRHGENVPGDVLHDILREIDTNRNGQVELDEYLMVSLSC